jgi:methylenetetrahydrofolate dehydrogenase (NADP+)/methenyltetrahydrofolate cyclohydrolase
MIIIDGKACRDKMSEDFIKEIIYLKSKGISPRISILQVEGNNASDVYVRNKLKFCEKVGARGELIKLPANSSNDEVKEAILKLNNDKDVNGILLQLPLPQNLNEEYLTNLISEDKDVDCFHVSNVGKL